EVRVSEAGHLGRRGGVDLLVQMNPQTWDQDLAELEPGGILVHDASRHLPPQRFREGIRVIGIPLTALCAERFPDVKQRLLFKNIVYVGALAVLLGIELPVVEALVGEQSRGKEKLLAPDLAALHLGADWARVRKSTRLNSSHVTISYAVFC